MRRVPMTAHWICALLISALVRPAAADIIVLKDGTRISGKIVQRKGVGDKELAVVKLAGGATRSFLVSQIDREEPSIDERSLEQLDPREPSRYFDEGSRYAKDAEDPDARACAEHLLRAAMDLDPKLVVAAHARLAELYDGSQRVAHLLEVLKLDSSNEWARQELRDTLVEGGDDASDELEDFLGQLEAALERNQPGPLVVFARSDQSASLFQRLAVLRPTLRSELAAIDLPQGCKECKGTMRIKCPACKNGIIACVTCKGRGKIRTTVQTRYFHPLSGMELIREVPRSEKCPACDGSKGTQCYACQGGWVACRSCAKLQNSRSMSTEVRQALMQLRDILKVPAGSKWSRELLAQDGAPFRGLTAAPARADQGVDERYYRRGGAWRREP